jgi:hypothetical protein
MRIYTDHEGVEACCISIDGACSAPPETLPWARGEVTGLTCAYVPRLSFSRGPEGKSPETDERWFGQVSSIHLLLSHKG